MRLLRTLFGRSVEEVWRQLCAEIGAEFLPGGVLHSHCVQAYVADWIVTLDTFPGSGASGEPYARLRAPYVNLDGFRFGICSRAIFGAPGLSSGEQTVEVGDPQLDRAFVIQGNDVERVRALFTQPWMAPLLLAQPEVHFSVQDDEGPYGAQFVEGVDELFFQVRGVMKNLPLLRGLFELFSETLHYLSQTGQPGGDPVAALIQTLSGPQGRIESDLLLWDGGPPRRRAAEALGRSGDPRAVAPLQEVLLDPDGAVRQKAVWALGQIGDRRAAPALIPLLGDQQAIGGRLLSDVAAEALTRLGAAAQVEGFHSALRGDRRAISPLLDKADGGFVLAFERALKSADPMTAGHAAQVLADLGAVSALPAIQRRARRVTRGQAHAAALFAEAIDRLTVSAALPRPGSAPAPDTASLPRPGVPEPRDKERLPRSGSRP